MIRPITAILIVLVSLSLTQFVSSQTTAEKRAAKMKAEVEKLGTGPNARLTVELTDGNRVSGYVSKINEKTFILISDGTGAVTEIEYADAKISEKRKKGMSKALQIVLAVGIVVGGLVIYCSASGRCQQ